MWFRTSVLVLLSMLWQTNFCAAAEKTEWIIDQQGGPDLGDHVIYVSPNAVRIVNQKLEFEILSRAPDWKVCLFKRKDKSMKVTTKVDRTIFTFWRSASRPNPFIEVGAEKWNGLKCTKYLEPRSAFTLTADDIKVNPGAAKVICDYYNIPVFKHVPLINCHATESALKNAESLSPATIPQSFQPSVPMRQPTIIKTAVAGGKSQANWLKLDNYGVQQKSLTYKFRTRSLRNVELNADDFRLPDGLREVSDMSLIVLGSKKTKQIESMIDDIGFTTDRKHSTPNTGVKR